MLSDIKHFEGRLEALCGEDPQQAAETRQALFAETSQAFLRKHSAQLLPVMVMHYRVATDECQEWLGQLLRCLGGDLAPRLLALLDDQDPNLAATACWLLVEFGEDSEEVEAGLLAAMYHQSPEVAAIAGGAWLEPSPKVIRGKLEALGARREIESDARSDEWSALWEDMEFTTDLRELDDALLETVLDAARSSRSSVRAAATSLLAFIPDQRAAKQLFAALSDDSVEVRIEAITSIHVGRVPSSVVSDYLGAAASFILAVFGCLAVLLTAGAMVTLVVSVPIGLAFQSWAVFGAATLIGAGVLSLAMLAEDFWMEVCVKRDAEPILIDWQEPARLPRRYRRRFIASLKGSLDDENSMVRAAAATRLANLSSRGK